LLAARAAGAEHGGCDLVLPSHGSFRNRGRFGGPTAGLTGAGLAVLIIAVFLPQVDFFIVNVALPTIQSSLGASAGALELVVAGYGTAYAATLVLGGRLGDMIGRRRMLLIGLSGFVLTSLICGIAPGIGVLLAARILQGGRGGPRRPPGDRDAPRDTERGTAAPGVGTVQLGCGCGDRGRPAHRWPAGDRRRGRHRLAADLPGQRADRGSGADRGRAPGPGVALTAPARTRPGGDAPVRGDPRGPAGPARGGTDDRLAPVGLGRARAGAGARGGDGRHRTPRRGSGAVPLLSPSLLRLRSMRRGPSARRPTRRWSCGS
jgi:hypothetical protein